jgi:DsbC/DsbD-like thiol-disulfide interchange protein
MGGRTTWAFVTAAGVLFASGCFADDFSTVWAASAKSQARLIAAAPDLAGFEIALAPGAITYWRDPGDAGAPPTFDFAGSENVARVEPLFPAPERIAEPDGSEAFGYAHGVVVPLRIERRDPSKPATLAVHVNYAVCEKICLPAQARLSLTLPDAPSPFAGLVEAAFVAAPRPVPIADFGDLSPDGDDAWLFCAAHQVGNPRDLFVESPEGWRLGTAPVAPDPSRDCFRLTVLEKPKDPRFPIALRLTLTGGKGPVEATMEAGRPK